MQGQLSIIIPIYNVEHYLTQCLNSIVSQKYDGYEIILVNDGSTDDSGKICSLFAESHSFIRVIHKQNGGLSEARNVGIEAAAGKYVMFVDADDFIAENSLTLIGKELDKSNEPDLIFLRACKFFPSGVTEEIDGAMKRDMFFCKPQNEVLAAIATKLKYPGSAWAKIIKKNIITEGKLTFEAGETVEDLDFILQLILRCQTFDFYDFPFYCYRQQRDGSITYKGGLQSFEALLRIVKRWSEGLYPENYKPFVHGCAAYEYTVLLYFYSYLSSSMRIIYKSDMKRLRHALSSRRGMRYTCIKICIFAFGYTATSRLLRFYNVKLRCR